MSQKKKKQKAWRNLNQKDTAITWQRWERTDIQPNLQQTPPCFFSSACVLLQKLSKSKKKEGTSQIIPLCKWWGLHFLHCTVSPRLAPATWDSVSKQNIKWLNYLVVNPTKGRNENSEGKNWRELAADVAQKEDCPRIHRAQRSILIATKPKGSLSHLWCQNSRSGGRMNDQRSDGILSSTASLRPAWTWDPVVKITKSKAWSNEGIRDRKAACAVQPKVIYKSTQSPSKSQWHPSQKQKSNPRYQEEQCWSSKIPVFNIY